MRNVMRWILRSAFGVLLVVAAFGLISSVTKRYSEDVAHSLMEQCVGKSMTFTWSADQGLFVTTQKFTCQK